MGDVLGRKQRIKNSEWIEAFAKIEQAVSRKELDQLIDKTAERIPWSWGKSAVWRG